MGMYRGVYGKPLKFDTTPHEIFVEMDELNHETKEWVEQCRWVKYEERREPGSERWGRPHVSSLDFHSLVNLRQNLDRGSACIILDFEGKDFTNVAFKMGRNLLKKLTCLMRTKLHCCGCCSTNTVSSRPALKLVPVHLEGHTISLPRPKKRLTPASKKHSLKSHLRKPAFLDRWQTMPTLRTFCHWTAAVVTNRKWAE